MTTNPWLKFYPTDWRGDAALRSVSSAARGLWIDLISLMHEAEPYGHLLINGVDPTPERLVRMLGGSLKEVRNLLAELENAGVFSRTNDGIIYSRRMVRDHTKSARDKANGKVNGALGGNPEIRRGTVPKDERLRRFRRSDNPAKALRIFNKSKGLCHWCATSLEGVLWHADHVVAIADGGTNDDENLVAACAECNHKRARKGWSDPNQSDPNPADLSDPNTQIPEARIQSQKGRGNPAGSSHAPARATPRRRLPEGWEPNGGSIGIGLDQGLTQDDIHAEADKMRDWARHRGEVGADWDARFNNWLRKEASDRLIRRKRTEKPTLQQEWGLGSFLAPGGYVPPDFDDEPSARPLVRLS